MPVLPRDVSSHDKTADKRQLERHRNGVARYHGKHSAREIAPVDQSAETVVGVLKESFQNEETRKEKTTQLIVAMLTAAGLISEAEVSENRDTIVLKL